LHVANGDPPEIVLMVDGYRPTSELRNRDVARAASDVAVVPAVRKWMRQTQQSCVQFGSLVMEGRDIATNVFPETNFKFWLDASKEERARRRREEGVIENLTYRDRQDSQRAASPLMPGLGAVRIETTDRRPETIVAEIVDLVRAGTGSTCSPVPS
jgi:cytidylate kinase